MPGVPRSTTNAEMPLVPRVRSVTAMTTMTCPERPCVMNVFEPEMTHLSPSRTAVVRVPAASLPAVGSVSPQAPSLSPRASGSSVPLLLRFAAEHEQMCAAQSPLCAATDSETAGSTRASSSMQMQ